MPICKGNSDRGSIQRESERRVRAAEQRPIEVLAQLEAAGDRRS